MEALLIDTWLRTEERIDTRDHASVSEAREWVRREGVKLGMPAARVAALVTAASELANNQLSHARGGCVAVRPIARGGVAGLEVIAADRGDGIADPPRALSGATPAPAGLGAGLAGARRLVDELDIDVRLGEGTCVWARKFAEPVPRRREVGAFGRAHPTERVSGDHGAFVRTDDALLLAAADGLGHGPAARDASRGAVLQVLRAPMDALDVILDAAHGALTLTRGAVMALARVDERTGALSTASVGNVTVYTVGPSGARRYAGSSAVLGMRGPARPPRVEDSAVAARDAVILFTDGLTQRASLDGELDLLREHPVVVAYEMVTRFARPDDDALVIVAR